MKRRQDGTTRLRFFDLVLQKIADMMSLGVKGGNSEPAACRRRFDRERQCRRKTDEPTPAPY